MSVLLNRGRHKCSVLNRVNHVAINQRVGVYMVDKLIIWHSINQIKRWCL